MAELRKVKKTKAKKPTVKKQEVKDKDYVIIDYASYNSEEFLTFIKNLWLNHFELSNNDAFLTKMKLYSIISEIRYHIAEKQRKTSELAQRYGTYDSIADNWVISPESQQKFQKELNTINDIKFISESEKIEVSELKNAFIFQNYPFTNMNLEVLELTLDFINYDSLYNDENKNKLTLEEQ